MLQVYWWRMVVQVLCVCARVCVCVCMCVGGRGVGRAALSTQAGTVALSVM